MAARKTTAKPVQTDEKFNAGVLAWMREFEDGVSIREVAEEFDVLDTRANRALVELSDDDLIDIKDGMWVVLDSTPAAPVAEAPKPARKATAPKTEAKAPEAVTEAPEPTGRHAKPVQEAEQPVKAADGTNVTVPVSEGSEERRELDAAKGERLISEDFIPSFEESKITEDFTPPVMIPAVPAGVNENTWVMAHYANTESARKWWMAKAQSQMVAAA